MAASPDPAPLALARRPGPLSAPSLEALVGALLAAVPSGPVTAAANALCDALDALLREEGLLA